MQCPCGGTYRRSDLIAIPNKNSPSGFVMYDTDMLVAHWYCDSCGKVKTQKKRQPKIPYICPTCKLPLVTHPAHLRIRHLEQANTGRRGKVKP